MSSQKLYEVQAYGVLTYHRQILEDAVVESTRYNNAIAQKENADALAAMKASGKIKLQEPSAAELSAWKQALQPVYEAAESRVPQDLVHAIQKEVAAK